MTAWCLAVDQDARVHSHKGIDLGTLFFHHFLRFVLFSYISVDPAAQPIAVSLFFTAFTPLRTNSRLSLKPRNAPCSAPFDGHHFLGNGCGRDGRAQAQGKMGRLQTGAYRAGWRNWSSGSAQPFGRDARLANARYGYTCHEHEENAQEDRLLYVLWVAVSNKPSATIRTCLRGDNG